MATAAVPTDVTDAVDTAAQQRAAKRLIAEAQAAMREQLERGIVLGTRTWVPIRTVTFELERIRLEVMRRAGILGLFPEFQRAGQDTDALTARVLDTAFANGALFELLAHLLVEDGADYLPWSKPAALERAQRFASLVDAADHQTIENTILLLVLDFFLKASASMPISLKSLVVDGVSDIERAREQQRSRQPNTRTAAADSPSAATTTSGDGTPLSAPLLDSAASTS